LLVDATAAGTRVLVIDDDAVSRDVIRVLLEARGHKVVVAPSGDRGVDLVRSQFFHTILVDLQMPGLAGTDLAAALRAVCGEQSKIIAMSGSAPSHAPSPQGFDAFLAKPFAVDAFIAVLYGVVSSSKNQPVHETSVALDRSVYDKLATSMKPAQLEELYTLCLDDTRRRIDDMTHAAQTGDDLVFRREAHATKGGAGMVGACELQKLASLLEEKGLTANYLATLHEMKMACGRLEGMLFAHARRE
jgi:CheY-like chemotaxis protein